MKAPSTHRTREVEDVMAALDEALAILDEHVIYDTLPESARRLVNQAVFLAIIVSDPGNIQAQLTPLYETIKLLIQELRDIKERPQTRQKPTTPGNKTGRPQNDRDPDFRGRGSYIGRMAGATGLEPATSAVTGQRSNLLSYAPANARKDLLRPSVLLQYGKACALPPISPQLAGQPSFD
jgi:hypothetical protein